MNLLIVSPHRDDAALSLSLAIEGWLDAGHNVTVLNCFTRSEWAPYSDVESLHPNDRTSFVTAVRRREDLAWNKLLRDRVRFHDLDLFDAPLRLACTVPEVFTLDPRPGDRAEARVAGAIEKLARSAQAVVLPLALGHHVDHRIVRNAAAGVMAANPGQPAAWYEDLPYAAQEYWTARMETLVPAGFETCYATLPADDPATAIARKARLAECYDSQIDSTEVKTIAGFAGNYAGRERLWGNAAWQTEPKLMPFER